MPTPLTPPKPPEPPLFNHDQTRDIKMLGLASLLGGSGLAALRMFKPTPTMDIGGTGTFINIPVPYQAEVRRAGIPKSLAYKKNKLSKSVYLELFSGKNQINFSTLMSTGLHFFPSLF